jgi:hypothetical protein
MSEHEMRRDDEKGNPQQLLDRNHFIILTGPLLALNNLVYEKRKISPMILIKVKPNIDEKLLTLFIQKLFRSFII